jgi:NAD(P)-dependent dehydrogenase (short-subunit alcohol dehydrogenase family)
VHTDVGDAAAVRTLAEAEYGRLDILVNNARASIHPVHCSTSPMTSGIGDRHAHIARVVLFAASDLAAFMTGSTLVVDAGDLLR